MRERFRPADIRFLFICLAVLVGTVWFSAHYFYRAFPEASIDFRVTRGEARSVAAEFLRARGYDLAGYREASRFQYDSEAKTFLEREVGLEQANRIMGTSVRLWRWSYRWFRPLQKEEFRADVTPRGEPVAFLHQLPEAAPRPYVTPEHARTAAEQFLTGTMRRDLAGLEFVEGSTTVRPARTDYVFTWKQRNFTVSGADYRLEVTIAGNEVSGYREYLKIPETWLREYDRLRSRNLTAQTVDSAFMVLLAVGLLVTLLRSIRRHDIHWGAAIAVGVIGAVLSFLSSLNSQPLMEFAYPTTDSYGSFVARQLLQSVTSALAAGGLLFVLTAAAEPVYRRAYGGKISLRNLFRPRGLRTKRFFLGAILGLTLTGIFVAYQTGFYLIAYRFGAWSPADVPYDDLLNTRFPWLFVLLGGFLPAVSEEFLFRMFAIPFLQRLLRFTAAAVLLAGFIWGFGHAGYPQQPFYIRGVEVGIGGVVLGLVMLRWGILPTLIWHYSVDAMYTALLLVRSHNPYFVFSGAATAGIMLLPVAAAWLAYIRKGGFEPETGLTNAEEGTAPEEAPAATPEPAALAIDYRPWSWRTRVALLLGAAAVAALLVIPVQKFGDRPQFAVSRAEALSKADGFARGLELGRRQYRSVVYPGTGWQAEVGEYYLERRPVRDLAEAYTYLIPLYHWAVRYFKPLEQEELEVQLNPQTGEVSAFEHELPEDSPGADLKPEAARILASDFLSSRDFDLERLDLKESTSEKKKARRDYTLVWEAKPGDPRNLDQARFRVRVELAGDRVVAFSPHWKLPEEFLRTRAQRNALSMALLFARVFFLAAVFVIAISLLVQHTRHGALRWRPAAAIALGVAGLALLGSLAQFPVFFRAYNIALPVQTFITTALIGVVIAAIGLFLALACAAGILLLLRPHALAAFHPLNRARLGPDALVSGATAVILAAVLAHLRWLLVDRFHTEALLSASSPTSFAAAMPAVSALSSACLLTLTALAAVALLAHIRRSLRKPWLAALLGAAALSVFVSGRTHTAGELLLQYVYLAAAAVLLLAWCRWIARDNSLAYVVAAWSILLIGEAFPFLSQPAVSLRRQGWLLMAALAATLLWTIWPALRGKRALEHSGALQ